jgi:tetratricopeptide (TPR) repeat protein
MGKTQLVLQYAYQKHESDKDCSVFWVPAFNTTSFMDAYRKIGEMMQIPQIKEKAENIEELVKAIKDKLSDESSGHWLLIIDNVDIFDVLDEDGDEDAVTGDLPLLDCLPNSRKGSIIFTTRNRRAAFDMAGENIIEVKKMNLVEAKALLVKCLDPKTANSLLGDDEAVVDRLLELLTCLPLAITQAGAYMTKNWTTASKYIGYYEENYEEALKLLNRKFRDEGWKPLSGGEYKSIRDPVARTWSISFDQIRKKDELAAEYLSSMACLSHQNIPTSLLPDCFSSRASEAIATLLSYSFISERSPDGPYDMHPLVHLVTREWLEETKSLDIWTKRTLSQIADVFPSEILENRAVWTELLPHAIHALFLPRPPEGDKAIEFDLLRKVGWCLESIGQFEEALKVAKQEVERRKEMFSEDNPSVRWAMSDVGTLLIRLGKYSEAEDWYSRAIELGKTVPGSEDKDTLTIMSMLVAALINQGRLSKAEKLNRQVLLRRMDILGAEHPHTVTSRSKLAVVLSHQGRYSEAEALHRQVLQSRENLYGPENADTLTSKSHLAGVLMSQRCQRKYEEAQEIYEQNLKLDQGMKGPKHPDTLSTMDSLGCLLHYQCKDDEAEKLHQRTLQLREEVLGPTHPMTLLSRSNLALVLNSLGRYDEAEELQMRALKGFRLILGENHPHNLTGMANLANIYLTKGKPKDAGNLTAQVIEKIRTDTGETHPETLASLNRLILLYLDKGMFEDGEILGLQVLEMARHELGDMHCHTLDSMAYLSRLPSKCGEGEKLKETEELQVSNVNPKKRAREDDDTENSEEVTKRAKG